MKKIRHMLRRKKNREALPKSALGELEQASENVPRITNDTVAAHREDVLSSARKYIYPLQHSKHRIVTISTGLFILMTISFFTYCLLALYSWQQNSAFLYRVTQVMPFPVAKVGSDYIAYENYLFELRHYTHYYETQLKLDFASEAGKQQLAEYKKRALERVVNDTYVRQLAKQHGVSVTNQELEDEIAIVRNQNRLGSDKGFEDALQDNFGWSVSDFKRSLKQQLLARKLVATLDTDTRARAEAAMAELRAGAEFAAVAKKYSDEAATKDNGGEFGFPIDRANRDLAAQTTDALFRLQPGQTSEIVNVGYGLEIVKNLEMQNDKIRAAHIVFNYKDINEFLNPVKEQKKAKLYITLPESPKTEGNGANQPDPGQPAVP